MTDRKHTPPPLPVDRVRLHVALWKIAKACGHDLALDAQQPDHVLVELVAELVTPALAKAFRQGWCEAAEMAANSDGLCLPNPTTTPYGSP